MARSIATALIAASALAVVIANPAVASDATLRAKITTNLVKLDSPLIKFREAADGFAQAKTATRLKRATQRLAAGIRRYQRDVAGTTTSSASGAGAKKVLLSGIRQFDLGLGEYKTALRKFDAGARKASTLRALRKAERRFLLAAKREEAALRSLGVERPD